MKSTTAALLLLLLTLPWTTDEVHAQQVEVIRNEQLQELLYNCNNDKIVVVNFWATWCRPCIEELPHFNALPEKYSEIEVLLVNLDAVETLESRVKNFISKNNLTVKVVLLDETDFDPVINQVDRRWSGAIPATVFVDCETGKRLFFEKKFEESELNQVIEDLLNNRPTKK